MLLRLRSLALKVDLRSVVLLFSLRCIASYNFEILDIPDMISQFYVIVAV